MTNNPRGAVLLLSGGATYQMKNLLLKWWPKSLSINPLATFSQRDEAFRLKSIKELKMEGH